MSIDSPWLETLLRLTTGSARFVPGDAPPYNPRHCLAIYHAAPAAPPSLELPTLLVGDVLGGRSGLGCTLLSPLPARPPEGAILIGVWDDIARDHPHLLAGLPGPPEYGYHIHLGRHVLLVAKRRAGCVAGLQTLAQLLAQFEGDLLPAGRLEDAPVFPIRSILYNPGEQHPNLQALTRLLGVPFAFKGCRLHIRLDASGPVGARPGPGCVQEAEAAEFGAVCREYGIELIPHVAWLHRWGADRDARILDDCRRLHDQFGVERIGLQGAWSSEGRNRFLRLLDKARGSGYILSADAALAIADDLPPGWIEALEYWDGTESPLRLERLAEGGHPFGLIVPMASRGFAIASPSSAEARLSAACAAAVVSGAREFGYGLLNRNWGRLWEMELLPATAALILGWSGPSAAGDATGQAARLIYGLMGDQVLAWLERLSTLYRAAAFFTAAGEWLLGAAFGEWPTLADPAAALDDSASAGESGQLSEALRQLRRKLPRNPQTLELFDYGLDALSALRAQARRLSAARSLCARARSDDAEAGRAAREEVEALIGELRPFALRTERLRSERGILSLEADALARRLARLNRARAELETNGISAAEEFL